MRGDSSRAFIERQMRTYPRTVAALLGVGACVAFNLLLGQDANFDARNYHIASVYRLLYGREGVDLIVQVQTWFNPAIYLVAYFLIFTFPPLVASSILAAAQGLNGILVFELWRRVYATVLPPRQAVPVALLSTLVGITGALFLSEAGTTFADGLLSMPLIAAVILVLTADSSRRDAARDAAPLLVGGLLGGLAVGLKLTNAVFCIGYAAMIVGGGGAASGKLRQLVLFGAGGAVGFACAAGWWHLHVFNHYGNPVYPFAGDVFRNALAVPGDLSDHRFTPERWLDYLGYPIQMALGTRPSLNAAHFVAAEVRFRDIRYLAGLVAAAAFVALSIVDRRKLASEDRMLLQLSLFYLSSYTVWMAVFGIARYAVVLELLGGGLLIALIARLASGRAVVPIIVVAAALMVLSTRPGVWGRMSFDGSWLGEESAAGMASATYVLSADAPLAYVAAIVPPTSRVVRVGGPIRLDPQSGIGTRVADIIARSPKLASVRENSVPDDERALRRFGLVKVPGSCREVRMKIDLLHVCALAKLPQNGGRP